MAIAGAPTQRRQRLLVRGPEVELRTEDVHRDVVGAQAQLKHGVGGLLHGGGKLGQVALAVRIRARDAHGGHNEPHGLVRLQALRQVEEEVVRGRHGVGGDEAWLALEATPASLVLCGVGRRVRFHRGVGGRGVRTGSRGVRGSGRTIRGRGLAGAVLRTAGGDRAVRGLSFGGGRAVDRQRRLQQGVGIAQRECPGGGPEGPKEERYG
mmetsp:Transcript_109475/g.341141  ORF Transcript_109475/g.341141 Transcript_109475/m.341141 type:complete len:209 (+) Transcript_109475:96-722(+)